MRRSRIEIAGDVLRELSAGPKSDGQLLTASRDHQTMMIIMRVLVQASAIAWDEDDGRWHIITKGEEMLAMIEGIEAALGGRA